jgi:hypothetical protein
VTGLASRSSLEVSVSLGASQSEIESIASSSGHPIPAAAAHALSDGSVFMGVQSGHGEALNTAEFATDSSNSYDLGVKIGDATPAEARVVGGALYLHLDSAALARAGGDPTDASKIDSAIQKAATYVPGLAALGQGGWVEASASDLQTLQDGLSLLGGSGSIPDVRSTVSHLRTEILDAFASHTTYAEVGPSGSGTEYSVTLDASGFATAVESAVDKALSTLPAQILGALPGLNAKAPSIPAGKTVSMSLYTQGSIASEIDFDLRQVGLQATVPVPVRVAFSTTSISAPSSAKTLDLSSLPSALPGALGGISNLFGSASGSSGA